MRKPTDLNVFRTQRGLEIQRYIGLPSSPVFQTYADAQAEVQNILDNEEVQRDEIRCGA
jgi:hypothetical protein